MAMFWLLCLLLAMAGASRTSHQHPVVTLLQGQLEGAIIPSRLGRDIYSFRGIPYAKPPVGSHRFQMSVVSIEDLPPELLDKIFEYLTPEELLNVQDVCIKWREIARGSSVWEYFVYSPDEYVSTEEMIKFIEKCPMVKHICTSKMPDKDKLVPAVIKNCFDIRSFVVEFMPTLTVTEIDALFEAFPNLDCFQIRIEYPSAQIVDRVSKCTKLKKLTLSGQHCVDGVFKPIFDGCVSLEYLSFNGGFPNVSRKDLLYVLQNMNNKLLHLQFGFSPTTQQIVNMLGAFTKLEDLSLHDATHGQVVDFSPLTSIKTLKSLKLECFASEIDKLNRFIDVLFSDPLPLLEKLNINFFHCKYDATLFKKICECYPHLKHLRLYGHHPDVIKDGFKDICNLTRLESLGFSSSDTITDDDTVHLAQCHKLKRLDLSSNSLLTDKTVVHITRCKFLETLDLGYCSITGQSFHLIAEHLKRLKFLDVKQCKNLDEQCVHTLRDKMPALKIITDGGVCFG